MKNMIIGAGAGLLAIVAVACGHRTEQRGYGTPDIDVAEVVVDSVTVFRTLPGYLGADKEIDLVARVDGYLTSVPYNAGDFVKKGTVLFTIESGTYADAVQQAQANLDNANASYAYASDHYAAMCKALQSNAVSQMEVLQAKSAMETARAQIASAKARLQTARTTLSYCTVTAPVDGHVSNCPYSAGAYLAGGASPVRLGTIYDDASVTANFAVDEDMLRLFGRDSAATPLGIDMKHIPVVFDEGTAHEYTADLSYVSPSINKSTGGMLVQAKIANPHGELRSGMYCKVNLPDRVEPHALLVRDASIGTDQLGKYVYVVNDSDKVVYTPIKTGALVRDSMRVVTGGLDGGARYVTKALLKVRDGMIVKPIKR